MSDDQDDYGRRFGEVRTDARLREVAEAIAKDDATGRGASEQAAREAGRLIVSEAMRLTGMSASQLAKISGVAPSTLSRAMSEDGLFVMSARTLSRVGEALLHHEAQEARRAETNGDKEGMSIHLSNLGMIQSMLGAFSGSVTQQPQISARHRSLLSGGEIKPGAWIEPERLKGYKSSGVCFELDYLDGAELIHYRIATDAYRGEAPEGGSVIANESFDGKFAHRDLVVARRNRGGLIETALYTIRIDDGVRSLRALDSSVEFPAEDAELVVPVVAIINYPGRR